MKTVGAIFADFVTAPAGVPSRLGTELAGAPVLVHTLRRLARTSGLDARCVVVRPRDVPAAEDLVRAAGLAEPVDVLPLDDGARLRTELLRSARKWHLDSWRGGLMGTAWFDEYVEARLVGKVLMHYACDAVYCCEGHQAALDPALGSAIIAWAAEHGPAVRHVFTQAPPGLAGVLLKVETVQDLLESSLPFGLLLAYRPEMAQMDPITHTACCSIAAPISQTRARFVADTRRARERLAGALAELGADASAAALCDWMNPMQPAGPGTLPVEVEVELTTADPLPETMLRPRGARVPPRQLADLDALRRVAAELASYDDALVYLGGHGDPLQHPQFAEVCALLRSAGVYGIAVGTPLVDLSETCFDALFAQRVDVLEVRVDAASAATYARVHGRDALGQVLANLERIERRRREQHAPQPILVPTLTRCTATLAEMEAFYDAWLARLGSAAIHGYSTFSGRLPPDALLSTTPPVRTACRRLGRRLMLLADGTVAACDQDVGGEQSVGHWQEHDLGAAWRGSALEHVRTAQASLELESLPVCGRCDQWFRP